ncbi:MAG TPA: alpha/beta fold hydrolase [Oligoflexus sp.]|uniref:alpha/beta fold hydrolase n=1 Tax=Oligoflexus sp. TaxID=1971216 RepID=UPI002D7E33E0|nr:alpha/beta fold hydrolase [Oligoflexus sp.]HET9237401.1 alpha/beta fold hydrolase [Oligoflexus sp.]
MNGWESEDRISEKGYAESYKKTILPFWKEGQETVLNAADGLRLYTWHRLHPNPRARIFIAHGYAESTMKYRELAFLFFQNAYSVYVWDHRGHGWSDRVGPEKHSVDVLNFPDYAADLHLIMQTLPQGPEVPTFLFGHSLGGAIAIDFMQKYPERVQAAVLSSPLLVPSLRGMPVAFAIWLARILARLHAPDKCSLGGAQTAAEFWSFKLAGTRSRERFEHFKEETMKADLRMAGPTNRWVLTTFAGARELLEPERMAKLRMPLFVATAGCDRLVRADAIQEFCRRAPSSEPHLYRESFHEIWNERDAIRNPYLDDVLSFYQRWEKR